jgi:uncharacterized membrane protein YqjE
MLHPLVRLLSARPDLLARHVGGYAQLIGVQAGEACASLRTRAMLMAGMGIGAVLGLGLGGVAVLLLAVVPVSQMPWPGLLILVPLLPLAGAAICGWLLSGQPEAWSLQTLREQLAADAALLHEASRS